ncbi:hypothetical protein MAH1_06850 [Sessilibacter sp. MAH1]
MCIHIFVQCGFDVISNKKLFAVHSWVGLIVGPILFFICISGTVSTISYELDWLLDPEIRVPTSENTTPVTADVLYHSLQEAYPGSLVPVLSLSPALPYVPAVALMEDYERGAFIVYLNPYSGKIIAERNRLNIKNFFRILHKQFFIIKTKMTPNGVFFVGIFGLFLLVSLVAGFLLLKNRLKNMSRIRSSKGSRIFWIDLHRSLGLWFLAFTLLFAVTGVWYLIEKISGESDVVLHQEANLNYLGQENYLPELRVDEYLSVAREAIPSLEIAYLFLPRKPGELVHIYGQAGPLLVRDAANYVAIDPVTLKVYEHYVASDLSAYDRWVHTADVLHFGTFGGVFTRFIWFFAGLVLSFSILAGWYLWLLRVKAVGSKAVKSTWYSVVTTTTCVFLVLLSTTFSVLGFFKMEGAPIQPIVQAVDFTELGPFNGMFYQRGLASEATDPDRSETLASGYLINLGVEFTRPVNLDSLELIINDRSWLFSSGWNIFETKIFIEKANLNQPIEATLVAKNAQGQIFKTEILLNSPHTTYTPAQQHYIQQNQPHSAVAVRVFLVLFSVIMLPTLLGWMLFSNKLAKKASRAVPTKLAGNQIVMQPLK